MKTHQPGEPSFWTCYFKIIYKPSAAFHTILRGRKPLSRGWIAIGIPALVYTLVYVFLVFGDGRPFQPWLDIRPEAYYQYNVFFCAPSMILGWILAAGAMQLVSIGFGGKGSFEQTLVVVAFGISVASWSTGVHDLVTSFLGATGVIDQQYFEGLLNSPTIWRTILWLLMSIYLIWFLLLFTIGMRVVQTLSWQKASLVAVIGFICYQGFFLIFNR